MQQTHTQNIHCLLVLYCKNSYTNAQKFYVVRTLPVAFNILTNVTCKSLCVRFYILIFVFLDLYVEMVTVRFHSLPHCETNDRSQLQLSAYLSVPHSF